MERGLYLLAAVRQAKTQHNLWIPKQTICLFLISISAGIGLLTWYFFTMDKEYVTTYFLGSNRDNDAVWHSDDPYQKGHGAWMKRARNNQAEWDSMDDSFILSGLQTKTPNFTLNHFLYHPPLTLFPHKPENICTLTQSHKEVYIEVTPID